MSELVLLSEVLSAYSLVGTELIVEYKIAYYFCKSAPQTQ